MFICIHTFFEKNIPTQLSAEYRPTYISLILMAEKTRLSKSLAGIIYNKNFCLFTQTALNNARNIISRLFRGKGGRHSTATEVWGGKISPW